MAKPKPTKKRDPDLLIKPRPKMKPGMKRSGTSKGGGKHQGASEGA